jgi:signal transduction histidine kinase
MNEPLEQIREQTPPQPIHRRNDTRKQMIAVVSHELRTPLTAIRGALGLLSSGAMGKLEEKALDMVRVAERNAIRLIELVDNLLDLEKIESGQLSLDYCETDSRKLIESSVDAVQALADMRKIKVEMPKKAFGLMADPERLVQVLINLLANAINFSPDAATVSLSVIEHASSLEFRVTDQGPGIPEKFHSTIFERFTQLDNARKTKVKGTGLGLWISRRIVQAHKGWIGVESELGHGSTFWFCIPKRPADLRRNGALRALYGSQTHKLPAPNLKDAHLPGSKLEH